MSGGPVIDSKGNLCGLVCGESPLGDPNWPLSYAASLFPIFRTVISADRGEKHPRGASYPLVQLVHDGIITLSDPENLPVVSDRQRSV